MTMRWEVFAAIEAERRRKNSTYSGIKVNTTHTVGEFLLIADAKMQEAKQAWVKDTGDATALCELLQVAAVAVACMETHGVVRRDSVAGDDFDNGTPPQSVEDAIHQLDAAKRRLCMALGLRCTENANTRALLDRAIQEIERLRDLQASVPVHAIHRYRENSAYDASKRGCKESDFETDGIAISRWLESMGMPA
jgi:hypothetical protein